MDFVCNANFKGDMKQFIDLKKLSLELPNSKLHDKPYQLVIKDVKGTLIFFSNGKFRIMGCIDELDATFLAYTYTTKIDNDQFPPIELQSFTSRCHLGFSINLSNVAKFNNTLVIYEPELFPALRICSFNPISVNVFSTGSVIICGIREPNEVYGILSQLRELCHNHRL